MLSFLHSHHSPALAHQEAGSPHEYVEVQAGVGWTGAVQEELRRQQRGCGAFTVCCVVLVNPVVRQLIHHDNVIQTNGAK